MQFVPKEAHVGFEAGTAGSLPWQMVPAGGARGLKLSHSQNLQFIVEPVPGSGVSGGLGVSETKLSSIVEREIWIQGRVKGRYMVSASRGGAPVVPLEAEVFPERLVKIAYYILPDCVGYWDTRKLSEMGIRSGFPKPTCVSNF